MSFLHPSFPKHCILTITLKDVPSQLNAANILVTGSINELGLLIKEIGT